MKPFLEHIAKYLMDTYGESLSDCCVVFPNRRAGLFFKKHLEAHAEKPIWSPAVLTISDLMIKLSELQLADDLEVLFELYAVYKEVKKTPESFDEFYFWGVIIMADFDDVDKYLVNARDLYQNIASIKSLEKRFTYLTEEQLKVIKRFWLSFNNEKLSDQKRNFVEIWEILYPVYDRLRKGLTKKRMAYEGMIYRQVAESLQEPGSMPIPYRKILFIGFNALNKCEEQLFSYLKINQIGEYFWDHDQYYTDLEYHEAGRFIRKFIKKFPSPTLNINYSNLIKQERTIRILSVPSEVGQAKYLPLILERLPLKSPADKIDTAIVLADEHLLMPVLHSLPENIPEINVTMGYPIRETPVYSLITHIISLQKNNRGKGQNDSRFYYKDILSILNHQYLRLQEPKDTRELADEIIQKNKIYLSGKELGRNELFRKIFRDIEASEDITSYMLDILEYIVRGGQEDEQELPPLEVEYIFQLYTRIKRLQEVLTGRQVKMSINTFLKLFHRIMERTRIPFTGEPLAGLQVMGLLETRVIDFRNVIFLSMNEGLFPRTTISHSFIPHFLRYGFGLPTLEHQDAIYAYYFYRLIQRAENVVLVFNSKTEGMIKGERSRFIYQLMYDPAFIVHEETAGFDINIIHDKEIIISKNAEIINKLLEYATNQDDKYLSPSALNTYLDCSLKFYFRYIAELEEKVEVVEEVDPLMFGNWLHNVMHLLYEPYMSLDLTIKDIEQITSGPERIDEAVLNSYTRNFGYDESVNYVKIEGRNAIISKIIRKYVSRILEIDKQFTPFKIIDLEKMYQINLSVQTTNGIQNISLGGKIDRIDKTSEGIRIIDYKTGKSSRSFTDIPGLIDRGNKNRNRDAFQALLYAKMVTTGKMITDHQKVIPGLYIIRQFYDDLFDYRLEAGPARRKQVITDYAEIDTHFTEAIAVLLEELFNPEESFRQTDNTEICRTCPYQGICHRETDI